MFYRAAYDQEQHELREMDKNERHNWLINNLNNPSGNAEVSESLLDDDHAKFKSICALRFIQQLRRK